MNRTFLISGALLLVTAVILGAFGAHALKEIVSADSLDSYEVGVRYQVYHGLALLILGFNQDKLNFSMKWVFRLLLIGVLLFSSSIYVLSLQEVLGMNLKFIGPITPIGGLLLIIAWTIFVIRLVQTR